jgi:hypothetical protein
MTPQPTFGVNVLIKLGERTEYETWLLEDVYTLVEQEHTRRGSMAPCKARMPCFGCCRTTCGV